MQKSGPHVVSPKEPCKYCGRLVYWFETRTRKRLPFEDMEFRGSEIFPGCYGIARRDGTVIPVEELRRPPSSAIARHYCSKFSQARRAKQFRVTPAAMELMEDALSDALF